jgi:hypothetical protein
MVRIPTERRFEELIERDLTSIVDDGLKYTSSIIRMMYGTIKKDVSLVRTSLSSLKTLRRIPMTDYRRSTERRPMRTY